MADSRVTEHYIATDFGISQDRIHAVIHNELRMSKVSPHCVQKLFGPDLKRTRLKMSSNICDYGCDLGPSLPTRDEATIEAVDTTRSTGKMMASIFWDAEGVLVAD